MLLAWEIERDSNYVEAIFWVIIGIGFAIRAPAMVGTLSRRCWIAAVTFFFFGISDFIEAQPWSGAWWRPWWLLVWKGICVLILAYLAFLYFRDRQRESQ
jgi:hypothetical protein